MQPRLWSWPHTSLPVLHVGSPETGYKSTMNRPCTERGSAGSTCPPAFGFITKIHLKVMIRNTPLIDRMYKQDYACHLLLWQCCYVLLNRWCVLLQRRWHFSSKQAYSGPWMENYLETLGHVHWIGRIGCYKVVHPSKWRWELKQ